MMNLNIISFNCKGFKSRNYDYLNDLFTKCDILMIQESWLYSFEFDQVSRILPNSIVMGVSAMQESEIRPRGRPFGGSMIIHKRNLALPILQVDALSKRICAATIIKNDVKLLLVSVYMPVSDNSEFSMNEFMSLDLLYPGD